MPAKTPQSHSPETAAFAKQFCILAYIVLPAIAATLDLPSTVASKIPKFFTVPPSKRPINPTFSPSGWRMERLETTWPPPSKTPLNTLAGI